MNIIERAGNQLGPKPEKSTIERAAAQLSSARPIPGVIEKQNPNSGIEVGRDTHRRIDIDFDRLRAVGFTMPGDQSPVAEEFRLIKRPLVSAALNPDPNREGKNRNILMVTSARPNEGKTFVALNLAFSIASEHDVHVLLIDGDVAKPSIPSALGFQADKGLIDVVKDESLDFADALIRTNIDNLSILPSGIARTGSSELIASARMSRFIEEVAKRYADRIIIFDSPPVLARSEPLVLAQHAGQIILVVEAERTSRTAILEAVNLLGQNRIAGVILNKAPTVAVVDQFGERYSRYGYYGLQ